MSKGGERQLGYGEGDNCWAFDPPADGTEYAGSVMTFDEDVIVTRHDDGEISFSRPIPSDVDFVALRFGSGLGWDADMILDPGEVVAGLLGYPDVDRPYPALAESCALLGKGETGYLALARNTNLKLRFHAGEPPRLEIVEEVSSNA